MKWRWTGGASWETRSSVRNLRDAEGWSSAVVVGLETIKREKQPDVCEK